MLVLAHTGLGSGKISRSVRFPEKIGPESAKADGLLRVTVAIAKAAAAKKVEIKAAE